MFCGNCGAKVPDGKRFCEQCGAPLSTTEQELASQGAQAQTGQPFDPYATAQMQPPVPPQPPEKRKSRTPLIIGIIAAVVVLVIIGAFACSGNSSSSSGNSAAAPSASSAGSSSTDNPSGSASATSAGSASAGSASAESASTGSASSGTTMAGMQTIGNKKTGTVQVPSDWKDRSGDYPAQLLDDAALVYYADPTSEYTSSAFVHFMFANALEMRVYPTSYSDVARDTISSMQSEGIYADIDSEDTTFNGHKCTVITSTVPEDGLYLCHIVIDRDNDGHATVVIKTQGTSSTAAANLEYAATWTY